MSTSTENPQRGPPSRGGILQTVLEDLASTKLATAVGSLIVLACILGTLLPQGADVQKFVQAKPAWAGIMKVSGSLGLTNVFETWWFIVLLVSFSFNLAACLIRRVSARLRAGRLGISGWGFLLTHISMLMILGGAVIRGAKGEKGELEIREGQTSAQFRTPRGPAKMPFEVRLVKFELEYYEDQSSEQPPADEPDTLSIAWPERHIQTQLVVKVAASVTIQPPDEEATASNSIRVVVSRYVPDFIMDLATHQVRSRSDAPNNPAIQVDVDGRDLHISKWVFANRPDFDMQHSAGKETKDPLLLRYHSTRGARLQNAQSRSKRIRSFKSTLQLLENGTVAREKTIEVNSPLSYRGYTLYQSGYNPEDLTWSTIQVVRDPGVPLVYTGFLCMIGGLILLLCFKPAPRKPSPEETPSDTEAPRYDATI